MGKYFSAKWDPVRAQASFRLVGKMFSYVLKLYVVLYGKASEPGSRSSDFSGETENAEEAFSQALSRLDKWLLVHGALKSIE